MLSFRSPIHNYERIVTFFPEEIFPLIQEENASYQLSATIPVALISKRLQTFKKNHFCVSCGIEGKFFAIERTPLKREKVFNHPGNGWHFNFYAIDPETFEERLMTRDHIFPRSLGGNDTLANSQTMCEICNNAKGANFDGLLKCEYIQEPEIFEKQKERKRGTAQSRTQRRAFQRRKKKRDQKLLDGS